jgi:hypothetical protein
MSKKRFFSKPLLVLLLVLAVNWVPAGNPISGTGNPIIFSISQTNLQLFFRLRVIP